MTQIIDAEYRVTFDATGTPDIDRVIPDKIQLIYRRDFPEVTEIRILGQRRLKSGNRGRLAETTLVDYPNGYPHASDWEGCSTDIPEWIRPLIPMHRPAWAGTAECGTCNPDDDYTCPICFPGGEAPQYLTGVCGQRLPCNCTDCQSANQVERPVCPLHDDPDADGMHCTCDQ
jgi:hypothetical protein